MLSGSWQSRVWPATANTENTHVGMQGMLNNASPEVRKQMGQDS